MTDPECHTTAATDPAGVPFTELTPAVLRTQRTSIKWTRYPADVLPLFVAEMDFAVAPEIRQALVDCVAASDLGYLDSAGALAPAFAEYAAATWGWQIPHEHVHLATDVATGVVEALRVAVALRRGRQPELGRPQRIVLPTPVYPGFFEMLEELPYDTVEVPLRADSHSAHGTDFRLDLAAIARAFEAGAEAFLLCNPHNPHGTVHTEAELTELARLAAQHEVFVVSDEIHAPLTHAGARFVPFAPIAAAAGALSVTTTSPSKGWNIPGTKCALIVAADARANAALDRLPPETTTRASILGLHAGIAAFTASRAWLTRAVAQIEANTALLTELVAAQLPGVRLAPAQAGYLAWLDFRDAGLGQDPHERILTEARVALNNGSDFGRGGQGHVRLNLACAPDTLREAVNRIAAILPPAPQQVTP